jgi:hypothetical protein
MGNDGSGSRLGSYDTSTYPGSGPSTPEVKPLLPALVFILSTWWLTRLLELYCLEVEEEVFYFPTLRVQAPLYRQGPGCSLVIQLPGCRLPRGRGLGTGRFIKRLFPLDRKIRGICPWSASDPFMEEGLARCGWWRSSVAGVTLIFGLCRSCRVPATFNKVSVGGFRRLCRLGPLVVKMLAGC